MSAKLLSNFGTLIDTAKGLDKTLVDADVEYRTSGEVDRSAMKTTIETLDIAKKQLKSIQGKILTVMKDDA